MTPKVLHRIWLDEPVPAEFDRYWDGLQALHPSWEFVTWDDSTALGWMTNQREFAAATTHAGRSDVLRYEIMAHHGGVYVDTDVEGLRPFDPLLSPCPVIGWEDDRLLCPTVMMSPPGHPAILDLVAALPRWFHRHRSAPPNQQTGPYFVTRQWWHRDDVIRMPPVTFYPVHWSSKKDLGGPYLPDAFSVHHWAAGWLPNGPPQR